MKAEVTRETNARQITGAFQLPPTGEGTRENFVTGALQITGAFQRPSPVVATEWTPSVNPWLIAISVMLATFMEVLDTSVANVALPHIAGNLAAGVDESTWVLTSYLISNAIILPATGWLSNRFGRKRFLVSCIVIFTLASFASGAATTLGFLIFARILQGAGGGALQPIAQAVLMESFPPAKRGVAMAVYGVGVIVAPVLGPTLGGWITDNYSWRWIFYINIPIGIIASYLTYLFVEDPPYIRDAPRGRIDYLGFGLMALWLSSLQVVLDRGQQEDWFSSSGILVLTLVSVASFIGFVVWELRTDEPIVDLRVLSDRNFAICAALFGVFGLILYGTISILPLFLQTLLGYSATASGLASSPRGLGAVVAMAVVGRLIGKIDERILIGFGFSVLAFATYLLGGVNLEIGMETIIVPNVLYGVAIGFIFVPLTTSAMGTLPNERMGNAAGVYSLIRNLGGSIGISLVTTLLARYTQIHQALMVAHFSPYDPAFRERLGFIEAALSHKFDTITTDIASQAFLYSILVKQATLLSYVDTFRILAILAVIAMPAVLLLRKASIRSGSPALH